MMPASNNVIYLALYKGRRDGAWYKPSIAAARLSDWTIRTFTQSIYSHCELAIAREDGQYDCYSSSIRDGGVRMKTMKLPADKWDLIEKDNHTMSDFEKDIQKELPFMSYAPILFVSVLTGQRISKVMEEAKTIAETRAMRISTSQLNALIADAMMM